MAQDIDFKSLDRRILDRMIKRGELTEKDLEKTLKAMPDLTDEAEAVQATLERLGDDTAQG